MDVSLEQEDSGSWLVKVASDVYEVNVRATLEELFSLRSIRSADWTSRSSVAAGQSAGMGVYWSANGDTATLLIGHDDETWDIAAMMPVQVIDDIVSQAEKASIQED
jgi:hypothetical protein